MGKHMHRCIGRGNPHLSDPCRHLQPPLSLNVTTTYICTQSTAIVWQLLCMYQPYLPAFLPRISKQHRRSSTSRVPDLSNSTSHWSLRWISSLIPWQAWQPLDLMDGKWWLNASSWPGNAGIVRVMVTALSNRHPLLPGKTLSPKPQH